MDKQYYPPPDQKPTAPRFLVFVVVIALTTSASAAALAQDGEPDTVLITEDEALAQVLNKKSLTDGWQAHTLEARAQVPIAGAFPNPLIGYQREQFFGDSARSEDTVEVEQRLPISGRPGLQADAARQQVQASGDEVDSDRSRVRRLVRQTFFEVLYGQQIVEVYGRAVERLDETIDDMERRVDAGDSSLYELERLRGARAEFQATLETEEAGLEEHRARLAGWLGAPWPDTDFRVDAQLLPADIPGDQEVDDAVALRPELSAADHRIKALELESDAAARWWIPDLILRGGLKRERHGATQDFGMEAGLALGLPLFYRGRGQRQRARGQLLNATADRSLTEELMRSQARGVARRAQGLVATTHSYREQGVERARRVLHLAEQSYEAGEAGLLELLDAHQNLLDARLRELELAASARSTYIELLGLVEGSDQR